MAKQTIEVDVPEGYEFDGIRQRIALSGTPLDGEIFWKKKPPRRRVFECVSEEPRNSKDGEWIEDVDGDLRLTKGDGYGKYKIFKEVKE